MGLSGYLLLLLALLVPAVAQPAPEAGVSRALAIARAGRVSGVRYGLTYTLVPHAATTSAQETMTFSDSAVGDLPVDFRDGELLSATLNGKVIPPTLVNGHLILPAGALVRGENKLGTSFRTNIGAAGKAVTRYDDKDDGSEYLYTLFVPMDASMAFPCFDQPDLKGRFRLVVRAPEAWTVVGNTAAVAHKATYFGTGYPEQTQRTKVVETIHQEGSSGTTTFAETQPIPTYLFAFAAGPFQRVAPKKAGEPALFVRASQRKRAEAEAPAVQQITARGIAWLSDYFAQPFPFPKYDLVLIPGFPFGGMEHAGATFLNEDSVLFRTAPTQADYFRRDILVLHETTHQWFGDLVTMRWFDDLWLKEGFAQYMAYKAEDALKPDSQAWKHFNEDIKPLAYGIDETQGTTPIFQQIPNLKDAKSAYGAIVYQKAPAVLKQLDFRINIKSGVDEDLFRNGLRLYLKQHAYANATWPDLIHAFEQAGAKDVQAWADAWILRRGMPQVEASFTCAAGKLKSLTLTQHDVLPDGFTWPMSNRIDLIDSRDGHVHSVIVADWSGASYSDTQRIGHECPLYIFANEGDEAYGRFLLDPVSRNFVSQILATEPFVLTSSFLPGTQLLTALWDEVRIGRAAPRGYAELALSVLKAEPDESSNRVLGGRVATVLHAYLGPQGRQALLPRAEAVVTERMLHAPTLGLRVVNFRTLASIAESPSALATTKALLDGSVTIPGMPLKLQDRWNLVAHLIAMADPDAEELFGKERAKDRSGEAQKYAFAAEAGTPDLRVKARYFDEYLHSADRPEDWLTQSLRPFNQWNQTELTAPYLPRALDALPEIKAHRKIFFLGAWLGAFVDGQHSPAAQAAVHEWLRRKDIDPDLRLKVLQVSDELDRTVMIRTRFPE